jgi:hypothetical protein
MSFRTVSILEQIERVSFGVARLLIAATAVLAIMSGLTLALMNGVDLIAWWRMNSAEYRAAIEALGLNQTTAAAWLGISRRQSAAYAIGESSVPPPTAMLLELCVRLGIRPEDVHWRSSIAVFRWVRLLPFSLRG